jgi:hypothetical protein
LSTNDNRPFGYSKKFMASIAETKGNVNGGLGHGLDVPSSIHELKT